MYGQTRPSGTDHRKQSQLGLSGDSRNLSEAVDSGFEFGEASAPCGARRGRRKRHPVGGVSDSLALDTTLKEGNCERGLALLQGRHRILNPTDHGHTLRVHIRTYTSMTSDVPDR